MGDEGSAPDASRPRPHDVPIDPFAGLPGSAWRVVFDSSPALVTIFVGDDQLLAYQNSASQRIFGARRLGKPLAEAFPELRTGPSEPLTRVLRTGETVEMPAHLIAVHDVDGEEVALSYVLAPFGDPPVGVVVTAIDATAAVRAQEQAVRTQLLADISNAVTSASDAASGLRALTDALVPTVADLAAVYLVPDDEPDSGTALPPEVMTMSDELKAIGAPPTSSGSGGRSPYEPMLRSGATVLIPVGDADAEEVAQDPDNAAWLRAADAHNVAVVPLVVAGTLTGVLVLLAAGERRPYQESDLPFLEDVTARAGAAIAVLRTLRRQRDVAVDLQRSLLPAPPDRLTGVTAAARYVVGAPDVEVGGDWWDLYDRGDGSVAIGIGDVSGRGIPAAAVMGQARAVMRAAGHARLSPVEVLELLDAQLSDTLKVPEPPTRPMPSVIGRAPVRFATACYCIVELADRRLRLASAGHLPLLLRSPDGQVRRVHAPPGAPLGVDVGGFVEISEALQAGDTLALFTDGLVESRTLDVDDGLARLADAFARQGGGDVETVADELLAAMAGEPGYGADDIALVVLRVDPGH